MEVVSGECIVRCHAIIDVVIDVRVVEYHASMDVVIGVRVVLRHALIDNSGFSTSCSLPHHLVRSDRTCSGRCRRPSTIGILCTVLWFKHRVVHTVQCFQLL